MTPRELLTHEEKQDAAERFVTNAVRDFMGDVLCAVDDMGGMERARAMVIITDEADRVQEIEKHEGRGHSCKIEATIADTKQILARADADLRWIAAEFAKFKKEHHALMKLAYPDRAEEKQKAEVVVA